MFTTASSNPVPNFARNRLLQALVGIYTLVWITLALDPLHRPEWLLENYLVFGLLAVLALSYRRFPFSDLSYLCLTLFLTVHAVGAHYGYTQVPFGFWLQDSLGLARNHFDRIAHCLFGVLLLYPVYELLWRQTALARAWASGLALSCILAFSAMYEILEAAAGWLYDPAIRDAFVGHQGDVWDSEKDMLLALIGAALALNALSLLRRLRSGARDDLIADVDK